MSRFVSLLSILTLILGLVQLTFAQEAAIDNAPAPEIMSAPGMCAPYMSQDSVLAVVNPGVTQTIPGSTLTFTGSVKNTNSFVLSTVDVWARIYKNAGGDSPDSPYVTQILVEDDISLKSNSEVPIQFTWKAPSNLPAGAYNVVLAVSASNNYKTTDFVYQMQTGHFGSFTVVNESDSTAVTLDAKSVRINGEVYRISESTVVSGGNKATQVQIEITNDSSTSKRVPLQWSQYAWGNTNDKNLRHSKTQVLELGPNETKELVYEVKPQSEGIVEVIVTTQDGETKNIVPIRFVQEGQVASEVVFAGLSGPALFTIGENEIFACVRQGDLISAGQQSLVFTLKDSNGEVIHKYSQVLQATSTEVVSTKFSASKNYNVAMLTVALKYNDVTVWENTTTYDCLAIDPTKCSEEPVSTSPVTTYGMYILLGVAVVSLIIAMIMYLVKNRRNNIVAMLFGGLILVSSLGIFGNVASAQSCTVGNNVVINDADGFADMRGAAECNSQNYLSQAYGGTGMYGNYAACDAGLTAGGTSINGACISSITFEPRSGPADRCVVRGHECEVPTSGSGPLVPTITGPNSGNTNTPYDFDVTSTDPDGDQIRYGLGDASCTAVYEWLPGSGYVNSGTSQTLSRSWSADGSNTIYMFAEDSTGSRSGCASHTITISTPTTCVWDYRVKEPVDDITDLWGNVFSSTRGGGGNYASLPQCASGLSAASDGTSAPVGPPLQCKLSDTEKLIKVGASCTAGPSADLKINGSDTNVTAVKGATVTLDWVSSNAVSCSLYGAGLPGGSVSLNGNTQLVVTVSDSYVLTCDGAVDQVQIDVVNQAPNPPTVTHPTGSAPPNTNTTFTISGSDPDNDTVFYEIDWDNDGAYDATSASVPSGTAVSAVHNWSVTGSQTFKVRTVDAGGLRSTWTSHTITITDSVTPPATTSKPNFNLPIISYTPSSGFNITTGEYDSIDVTFQTTNNGGSDTTTSANYQFQFDRGSNGYEVNTTGSLGLLNINQSVSRTETVSGAIPFGSNRIRVFVDSGNSVDESDESDNLRILDFTLGPPNPNLDISADRLLVRSGEKITLTWNTKVTYPMACQVFGPGITTTTFDPSINGATGTKVSEKINAKSVFTLSCVVAGTTFTDTVTIEAQGVIEET
jgi:hypothetical protein